MTEINVTQNPAEVNEVYYDRMSKLRKDKCAKERLFDAIRESSDSEAESVLKDFGIHMNVIPGTNLVTGYEAAKVLGMPKKRVMQIVSQRNSKSCKCYQPLAGLVEKRSTVEILDSIRNGSDANVCVGKRDINVYNAGDGDEEQSFVITRHTVHTNLLCARGVLIMAFLTRDLRTLNQTKVAKAVLMSRYGDAIDDPVVEEVPEMPEVLVPDTIAPADQDVVDVANSVSAEVVQKAEIPKAETNVSFNMTPDMLQMLIKTAIIGTIEAFQPRIFAQN